MARRASGPIWVTGASSGIGRALALKLARQGRVVAASARSLHDLAGLADDARLVGGVVRVYPLDVADRGAVAATARQIVADLGPIECAVFAAGTHLPVEIDGFDADIFRRLVEVNFMGVVHGLEAVLPAMIAARAGHIAIVSSVAGYRGLPTAAAYGATKAALINMAEALKLDCDRAGIKLQLIDPGFVRTPLTDKNPFPMPFLIEADLAADRIIAGLVSRRFEITFPKRFTWQVKLLRMLPYPLYFWLVRKATGR
ncbi:MAG: SDR family NAD(P)-dependent oxidoreductase [Alphaproteobacteria bacterium]|nr:SDR family NAD(P)-dependent oxidoreductase [Alphaproteobacteria bacterium]